jgi:Dyp-type peroxidase family
MSTEHLPHLAQSGITDRPAEHLLLVAFDLVAGDPSGCHAAMERLRTLVRAELHGHPANPALETGELGYEDPHKEYDLTILMALSDSGYTKLGATAANRPLDLHPMPADILDASQQGRGAHRPGEGDVLLKITANDIYVAEHVSHRIEHELSADFTLRWAQTGAQRYNTNQPLSRSESRALIGFLDGTNNLHPDNENDRALIFTDHTRTDYPSNPPSASYQGATFPDLRQMPAGAEPAELDGGSYLAVETLLISTGPFDNQSIDAQAAIIGRQKIDGAMISPPVPSSHVQKANPHRPGTDDELRRMLRRGYPTIRPVNSGLGRGLVFMAFARSLTTQHEFVRRAWINNPNFPQTGAGPDQFLATYVDQQIDSGGYYFAPPLTKQSDKASWRLPASAAS